MNYIKYILLFFVIFKSILLAFPYEVSHTVTPNVVSIGDKVIYKVSITSNRQVLIKMNVIKKEYGSFKVLSELIERSDNEQAVNTSYEYVLGYYSLDAPIIPTNTVILKLNNKIKKKVLSPIKLKAISNLENQSEELEGISEPLKINIIIPLKRLINWKIIVLFLFVIVVIFFLIKKYLSKLKQSNVTKKNENKKVFRTPEEIAFEELNKLKKLNLYPKKLKIYYLKQNEIIKSYLSNRYQKKIVEMTASEIIFEIKLLLPEQVIKKIMKYFYISDLVKFAQFIPDQDVHDSNETRAEEIIVQVSKQFKIKESTEKELYS